MDKENPLDQQDRKTINNMAEDMTFAIEWMETGKQPGTYRGIDKRAAYQRKALENMDIIPDIIEQLDINNRKLYMTREEKIILADILSSFSLRERQCYLLYAAQAMSMGQIADELGISKATVQMYISRARKKVASKVEKKVS